MKKLVLIAAAALLLYSACSDVFFPEPVMPDSAFGRGEVPPNNVTASHGERRTITLSWDSAPGAAMYYIFKADSPLMDFIRCAETDRTDFSFAVDGQDGFFICRRAGQNGVLPRRINFSERKHVTAKFLYRGDEPCPAANQRHYGNYQRKR